MLLKFHLHVIILRSKRKYDIFPSSFPLQAFIYEHYHFSAYRIIFRKKKKDKH